MGPPTPLALPIPAALPARAPAPPALGAAENGPGVMCGVKDRRGAKGRSGAEKSNPASACVTLA